MPYCLQIYLNKVSFPGEQGGEITTVISSSIEARTNIRKTEWARGRLQ